MSLNPLPKLLWGLRHNLTHGEEGGGGEHWVHSCPGWISALDQSAPVPCCTHLPRWVSEPESLLWCKSDWISSYWSLFCGPIGLHPCIHHCHRSASLSLLCSCLSLLHHVSTSVLGWAGATVNGSPAPSCRQQAVAAGSEDDKFSSLFSPHLLLYIVNLNQAAPPPSASTCCQLDFPSCSKPLCISGYSTLLQGLPHSKTRHGSFSLISLCQNYAFYQISFFSRVGFRLHGVIPYWRSASA